MFLGFSSGVLHRTHDRLAPETFDIYRKIGCNAIELMIFEVSDINSFIKLRTKDLEGFDYISVHSPIYRGPEQDEQYRKALDAISKMKGEINYECVVIHPDQFEDINLLKEFDLPYAVENMDHRKTKYRNVDDFKELFKDFNANFVLDLNHIYVNDNSMKLAKEFIDSFKDRLVEYHLSGFEILHDSIYLTQQDEIIAAVPDTNLPIIMESGGNPLGILEDEYNYVKNTLESRSKFRAG